MASACATAGQLLILMCILLAHQQQLPEAVPWTQVFGQELSTREFFGYRLCGAPPSNSVFVDAVDAYNVMSASSPGLVYLVRSSINFNVIFCTVKSVMLTYSYLAAGLVQTVQWSSICENTLNLTIRLQPSETGAEPAKLRQSVSAVLQLQPCNYTIQHEGITAQQLTSWILLTYTADWNPVWLNRTLLEPGGSNSTAWVTLISSTDPLSNATWSRVRVNSDLLGASMSPSQRVQATLTSVSTAPGQRWWLLICGVINATETLLVTIGDSGNETIELHMNCSSPQLPTLTLGPPSNASRAAQAAAPAIESYNSGYWGQELRRLLTEQSFRGLVFCNASASNRAIRITGVDDIAIGQDAATLVRGSVELYVTPCNGSSSLTVGDAFLKVFLPREANWSKVCADSVNPMVTVNLQDRTALRFSPCPAEPNADFAAKLAWCILALNSSEFELQWLNRDTNILTEPSAASVSFRILSDTNGTVLRWGNVQVNRIAVGDNAERLVQVFQSVNISYWPIVCQLFTNSTDKTMVIEIESNLNSSRKFSLYSNCSLQSELSSAPPLPRAMTPVLTTTATSSSTSPTASTTNSPTTTSTTTTSTTTSTATTPTTTTSTTVQRTTQTTMLAEISTTVSGPVTLSEAERRNKEAVQNLEDSTQIAVVVFALTILLLLSTLGICKLVAPRAV